MAQILTPQKRAGDYAQAIMDLGATICTPRVIHCHNCPWQASCQSHHLGIAATLPLKPPPLPKPLRYGIIYVAKNHRGAFLFERRPDKGLLRATLGWPGSPWGKTIAKHSPPLAANWITLKQPISHKFTHFHLKLTIKIARITSKQPPAQNMFVSTADFNPNALPSVMRKVWCTAQPYL